MRNVEKLINIQVKYRKNHPDNMERFIRESYCKS